MCGLGWDKCRAQIQSTGRHIPMYLNTSLLLLFFINKYHYNYAILYTTFESLSLRSVNKLIISGNVFKCVV